jgi:hypothetical protein
MVKEIHFYVMMSFGFNGCFVTGTSYTDGVAVMTLLIAWATLGWTQAGC